MRSTSWPLFLILCICATVNAKELAIDTVAGTGAAENNGDEGLATAINIGQPFGVEIGPDGALYITEVGHHRVRRLDLNSGELTTVTGCGRPGYSGDGGPAVEAELNEPYEVRFDRDGNMVFVEMQNHVVRKADAKTKVISTLAGTGNPGFGGDGGPATAAAFRQPHSIAFDSNGALYIADIGNHRIRRIDPKSGIVESVAGNGERLLPRDGQVARGNPILGPRAMFVEGTDLWIALREGHSIWRMDLNDGVLHHVAGTGKAGYSGDGGPAISATFNGPKGVAVGRDGNVYVVDTENNAIRRIDVRSNQIFTVVGSGLRGSVELSDRSPAMHALLNRPHGICVGLDGALYIGDTMNNRVRRAR